MGKELPENLFEPTTSIDNESSNWFNRLKQALLIIDENGWIVFQNYSSFTLLNHSNNSKKILNFSNLDQSISTAAFFKTLIERLETETGIEDSKEWIDFGGNKIKVNYTINLYSASQRLLSVQFDLAPNPLSNEKLLFEILNSTNEAILIIDPKDNSIIDCNERAQTLFEFDDKTQLLKSKGRDLLKEPFSNEKISEVVYQINSEGRWSEEIEYIAHKGRVFWCLAEVKLIRANNSHLFLLRLTDIDEKKKAKERIKVINKRYQDLVLYNQALLCIHDIDGTIQSINPSSYKSLGYSNPEELIGQNLKIIFEPKNYEAFSYYMDEINTKGQSNGVMHVVAKDGRKMFWLYNNYKVNEPGAEPYVVGTAQDITERIYAERELKKAKELAEQLLKAREMFLANVSHELRTPLHGILNINNFLSKTKLKPNQLEYTKIINRSAENLLFLVNDILDIAKMESGNFNLEPVPFDLFEVVNNSSEAFKYKALGKNLKFTLDFPKAPIETLKGDSNRLSQIINNLLSNAIKFTHVGEIRLEVEVLANINEVILLEIKVSDTGIGIPKGKYLNMFQNYSQLHKNNSMYGGTGLGLSICRKLLEAQKGYLYYTSIEGIGSEFAFIISYPKATLRKKKKKVITSQKEDLNKFKKLNILLVEDNPINQLICKSILNDIGIEPALAEDGATALEMATANLYDLILMDIMLPDIGGKEITTIIRGLADKRKSEVPIMALTANAMKGDSEIYLQAGMNDYLSKPYTEQELISKISELLNIQSEPSEMEEIILSPESGNTGFELFDLKKLKAIIADDDAIIKEYLTNHAIQNINSEIENLKNLIKSQNTTILPTRINNLKQILVEIHNERLDNLIDIVEKQFEFGAEFQEIIPNLYKTIALLEQIVIRLNQLFVTAKKSNPKA